MKTGLYISEHGHQRWYLNDELHRIDGPAVIYSNGDQCWYKNGKLHRLDGPAISYITGDNFWYINGQQIARTESKFKNYLIQKNLNSVLC